MQISHTAPIYEMNSLIKLLEDMHYFTRSDGLIRLHLFS